MSPKRSVDKHPKEVGSCFGGNERRGSGWEQGLDFKKPQMAKGRLQAWFCSLLPHAAPNRGASWNVGSRIPGLTARAGGEAGDALDSSVRLAVGLHMGGGTAGEGGRPRPSARLCVPAKWACRCLPCLPHRDLCDPNISAEKANSFCSTVGDETPRTQGQACTSPESSVNRKSNHQIPRWGDLECLPRRPGGQLGKSHFTLSRTSEDFLWRTENTANWKSGQFCF